MSGYHRISKLKSCISSLNSLKSLKKLNDNLGKELNLLCSNVKSTQDTSGYVNRIKELNQVLTQEFKNVTANIRTKSTGVFNTLNGNITNSQNKLKEGCKPLYHIPDTIEERKSEYRHKHLKTRHIKKEAEKLCQYLSKRQTYGSTVAWGAAGLSMSEIPKSLTEDVIGTVAATKAAEALDYDLLATISTLETASRLASAEQGVTYVIVCFSYTLQYTCVFYLYCAAGTPIAEMQASAVFNTAENISTTIEAAEKASYEASLSPAATVLNKSFANDLSKSDAAGILADAIPEPPAIPDAALEALSQLNALGEPTFASLGLGGWTPVGIVQQCMEYLHVTLGIDWWAAIVLATIVIRICVFPLVILSQRNAAKMHNNMPQMQYLQMKMTEARQTGDSINAARYGQEMMLFMKEKGLSPFKNMIVPLAQAPIFVSFFMGLRQMANVPVESLTHGGLFWFPDLTLPDQYFLLPIITSTTLWLTIELGTDGARLSSQNMQTMKYVLRAIPIIIFPFTMNFPGVILCYWVATNFISLGQVAVLKIPKVRAYFNIDQMMHHKPEDLPVKPKGFTEGLKDSWTNIKITRELEDRRRLDEIQFQKAGKGPIQKTFRHDPTKRSNPGAQAPISAKER